MTIWIPLCSNLLLIWITAAYSYQICRTPGCQRAAKLLKGFINPSENPCGNFYKFVCSRWQKANSQDQDEADLSTGLRTKILLLLIAQLEQHKTQRQYTAAYSFYKACISYNAENAKTQKVAYEYLRKFAKWPFFSPTSETNLNIFATAGKLKAKLNVDSFVTLSVEIDRKHTSGKILLLDRIKLGSPIAYYNPPLGNEFKLHYTELIFEGLSKLAKHFSIKIHPTQIRSVAESIASFEFDLAQHVIEEMNICPEETTSKFYNKRSVSELNALFKTSNGWQQYFKAAFDDDKKSVEWLKRNQIIVYQIDYLNYLANKFAQTDTKLVANYLMWKLLQWLAPYIGDDYSMTEGLVKNRLKLIKQKEGNPRSAECAQETADYFSEVFERLYLQSNMSYFDRKLINAKEVTRRISDAAVRIFQQNKWLSANEKKQMISKVKNVQMNIGYSRNLIAKPKVDANSEALLTAKNANNYFEMVIQITGWGSSDLFQQVDRREFVDSIFDINAHYVTEQNSLTLPLGIMNDLFFQSEFPDSFNYGAFGTSMAHELFHSFDSDGIVFDDKQRFVPQSLISHSKNEYDKRRNCIEHLYASQCYDFWTVDRVNGKANRHSNSKDRHRYCVDGKRTYDENIADIQGVKAAWLAYKLLPNSKQDVRLPGIEKYTMDQVFFVAYSIFYCENIAPSVLKANLLGDDTHSPSEVRVHVVTQNSPGFLEAWKCKRRNASRPICDLY